MDPISHFIIGEGLATLGGQPFTWNSPIYLASGLGSVLPDLDIVFQLKGDIAYLRQHRGFSHSLLGNLLTGIILGGLLKLFFAQASLLQLVLWSTIGALSHTMFDVCNSYGAQLLAPWSKRKFTLNLVQIFDPVLIAIFSLMLWIGHNDTTRPAYMAALIPLYLGTRWLMREHLRRRVKKHFGLKAPSRLVLMPSVLGLFNWDY
ncbi:MAG TPA: metal-dependent hydrolase, partial [Bacillota bacterium]|nr:metal-dependent hydrolase [Bacillota bacterium]